MRTKVIAVCAVLVMALLLAGLATRDRAPVQTQVAPAVSVPSTSPDSVPRMSLAVLQEKMARGEITIIDVRDADSYLASHIPGALHIPLSYIDSELPYLRKYGPIVTYCT